MAMANIRAKVEGERELQVALKKVHDQLREATDAAHSRLARQAIDQMQAQVPVSEGTLKSTIRLERYSQPGSMAVLVGNEGETEYLGAVEYGSRGVPPQPFVRPAATRIESSYVSTISAEVARRLG